MRFFRLHCQMNKWNKFSEFRFDQLNNEEERNHQIYGFKPKMREMIKKNSDFGAIDATQPRDFWPCDLRFISVDFIRFGLLLLLFTKPRWTNFVTLKYTCSQTYSYKYTNSQLSIHRAAKNVKQWNDVSSVLNRKKKKRFQYSREWKWNCIHFIKFY